MKIMIIGGTGRVGDDLVGDFAEKTDDEITVAARHPEAREGLYDLESRPKVNLIKFDMATMKVADMADKMKGFDAIYFVAGSRGKDLVQVESFGAIKTMMAAEKAGVERYIMLSSAHSLEPDYWIGQKHYETLQAYQAAKFIADRWLIDETKLNYTILQPESLLETKGEDKVSFDASTSGSNSINVVADVLFAVLSNKHAYHQVIIMHSGDESIADALDGIK